MSFMKRKIVSLAVSSIAWVLSAPVYALGILDAYSLALEKDPTFQAAIKEKEAGDEAKNIRRVTCLAM